MSLGILAALVAMLCWGFGDFFIQRSTRKIGDWETLFLITLFGALVLLPFVWSDIPHIIVGTSSTFWIVLSASLLLFVASLFEFEALKKGKLSIIEPAWSLEIPVSAVFASLILSESLGQTQIIFIFALIVGLFLTSYRGHISSKKLLLEKGIKIAVLSAILMGATNFFVGWGARETDPLVMNFFINIVAVIGSGIFLIAKRKLFAPFRHLVSYPKTIIPMMLLDNMAWVAFTYGLVLAPIGIAVALSESYIIIAVLLGIFVSREKLERHQYIGLVIALIAAIILATTT